MGELRLSVAGAQVLGTGSWLTSRETGRNHLNHGHDDGACVRTRHRWRVTARAQRADVC